MSTHSKAEKLLFAAGRLTLAGMTEFTAEDLVVEAHRENPETFAMKGYPHFPDSNSVLTQVMGKSAPLIVRGWVEKTGSKKYKLTPKGLDDINALKAETGSREHQAESLHLGRVREEEMGNLLVSSAFDLAEEERIDEVTFHQFCQFMGFSARDPWQAVQGKLAHARHLADEANAIGEAGASLRLFVRGRNKSFDSDQLRTLRPLIEALLIRFQRQMDEWKRNAAR
jgi:hypothetical protein